MTNSSKFERAFELVLHDIVRIAERLCMERKQQCQLSVRCLVEGAELLQRLVEVGSEGERAEGEARIVLRPGFRETSVKVAYKVIIRGLAAGTGFSGFSSEGRVDLSDVDSPVKIPAVSYEYNKWLFVPPFDFESRVS